MALLSIMLIFIFASYLLDVSVGCQEFNLEKKSAVINRHEKSTDNYYECARWILPHKIYRNDHILIIGILKMTLKYREGEYSYSTGSISIADQPVADNSTRQCLIYYPQNRNCAISKDDVSGCKFIWRHYEDVGDDLIVEYTPIKEASRREGDWDFRIKYVYFHCEASNATQTSTHKDKDNSGAVGAAIAFGIIAGLEAFLLIYVAVKRFKDSKPHSDEKEKTSETVKTSVSDNALPQDGVCEEENPIHVYHTVRTTGGRDQNETIVNQLYTIT